MKKQYIILFAGAVGSSKTPIAYYLSWKLGLPIFNNDAIRTEVAEDLGVLDEQEFRIRRDTRLQELVATRRPFIFDASIDREWKNYQQIVENAEYETFIISLDLGKAFLMELYKIKGYHESLARLDSLLADHMAFLAQFGEHVNVTITETSFKSRLQHCFDEVSAWLQVE